MKRMKKIAGLANIATLAGVMMLSGCATSDNTENDGRAAASTPKIEREAVSLLQNGLTQKTEDGVILHCFCWNFNTIKANMKEIAAAGYSAIQTSPVSKCLEGDNGGLDIIGNGKWYYHYQPTEYVVGNYQLGSEAEFKAMCDEAHKYGIKVLVDAVMNHCTSEYPFISQKIKDLAGGDDPQKVLFHDMKSGGMDERDRFLTTQKPMGSLWDWNTQNKVVQNYHLAFLKQCVADGADGFRYDAAKCIELPDDKSASYGSSWASDYWPTVLQNGSSFQYGEVLQEGGTHFYIAAMKNGGYNDNDTSRLATYHALTFGENKEHNFHTTSSFYGMRVRDAVKFKNMSVKYISDWLLPQGVSPVNAVTWVESHDSYCNEGTYKDLDEQQIIRAYAIIASREAGTPLFFDRPKNSSKGKPWGENKIGPAGSDMYKDPQVVALNFFHNEMGNAPETLSNPLGGGTVLMIERGTKGCVIINNGDTEILLEASPVKAIADGNYTDQAYGSAFTVQGGKISGRIAAGKVAVIYQPSASVTREKFASEVNISLPSHNFGTESLTVEFTVRGCEGGLGYSINGGDIQKAKTNAVVTLGKDLRNKESVSVTVYGYSASGKILSQKSAVYTKDLYEANTFVKLDSKAFPKWSTFYVYAYVNEGESVNAAWPGEKMKSEGNGIYSYLLPFGLENATIIFNNGNGGEGNQYDGPKDDPLKIQRGSTRMLSAEKEWTKL